MDFWRVQIYLVLNVRDHHVSFPDATRIQHITDEDAWNYLFTKLVESWLVFRRNRMMFYSLIQEELLAHQKVLQNAVRRVFSRPIRCLERFADNSNIPWNQPTTFSLDWIAEVSRMYLPSPCVPTVLQYLLSQIGVASKYNDTWSVFAGFANSQWTVSFDEKLP